MAAAISDPTRRDILTLLRRRTMSAGEIAMHFEISRPAVSRHLRVLRDCGVVVAELHGRQRFYRLETAPLAALQSWITLLLDRWSGPLDALETEVYRARRERRLRAESRKRKSA